jgi:RNA polymerase sigma-70 factor (ECF subfamily)
VLKTPIKIGEEPKKALGQLLDGHSAYLKLLAQRAVGGRLEARVDSSDLVQQTCLSAFKEFKNFDGDDEAQFVAWLRKIHEHKISDTIRRHVHTQKRAVGNEQSLDDSRMAAGADLAAVVSSPSQRAMRDEQAVKLAAALATLSDDQREAVRLRHLEGCTLAELAEKFERSEDAVAALLKRGLENLRKRLSH